MWDWLSSLRSSVGPAIHSFLEFHTQLGAHEGDRPFSAMRALVAATFFLLVLLVSLCVVGMARACCMRDEQRQHTRAHAAERRDNRHSRETRKRRKGATHAERDDDDEGEDE